MFCRKCGEKMREVRNYYQGSTRCRTTYSCGWSYCERYMQDFTEAKLLAEPLVRSQVVNYRAAQLFVAAYTRPVHTQCIVCGTTLIYGSCAYCTKIGSNSTQYRGIEMKEINVTYLYNDTIIELFFTTVPRRGWFAANIQPIVDIIKATIPSTSREYNSDTKRWQVAAEFWVPLEQILVASQFKINKISAASAGAPQNVNIPEDYAKNFHYEQVITSQVESRESISKQLASLLGVHEDIAKLEIVELKKKYREAARKYHPDLGGDAAVMSEINRLWSIYNTGVN